MIPRTLSPATIKALNELAVKLYDVDIHTPTQVEFAKNKAVIEMILPPADHGYVTAPYVMLVSIAYEYARVHYRDTSNSLLSDIEHMGTAKDVDLSKYKFRLE